MTHLSKVLYLTFKHVLIMPLNRKNLVRYLVDIMFSVMLLKVQLVRLAQEVLQVHKGRRVSAFISPYIVMLLADWKK